MKQQKTPVHFTKMVRDKWLNSKALTPVRDGLRSHPSREPTVGTLLFFCGWGGKRHFAHFAECAI